FCSVTAMFSRSVRHRRTDQVLAELRGLGSERVFFYDDNFVVNKRRATELLEAMTGSGLTPGWFAQVRADAALRSLSSPEPDDQFLCLMRRSGCRIVMIGIEAVTDESLAAIGKRLRVATVETAVRAFHRHGIAVHGMFVAGIDTDTAQSARATADFARRLDIDTFQLMVETPLPGTRLFERASDEDRLLSNDWSLFDGHQVVMRPAQMSPLELQLGVLAAMRRFYSWPAIVKSGLAKSLSLLPHLPSLARPAMLRQLPAITAAAWGRRWEDVAPLLARALPPRPRRQIAEGLWLPALRFYARRQLAAWNELERSREHLAYLRSLG
ncbi:MAG TPA: radical SAM protein, partial [Acidimicrobiales bacterium]|nr:radical SAM protein [Acidimicrobiales bacterium]